MSDYDVFTAYHRPFHDMTEDEFAREIVRPWLEHRFGKENVEHEYYLDSTGRFVDFLVDGPLVSWAIEAENDGESVLNGVMQARLYANHQHDWQPAVVTPPGHVEQPEASLLDDIVPIIQLPNDEAQSLLSGDFPHPDDSEDQATE